MIKIIVLLIVLYIVFQAAYSIYYLNKSTNLVKKTYVGSFDLGDKKNPAYTVWVDGDSVGAGVGATSFDKSVIGRIGGYLAQNKHVILKNESISGSRMKTLVNKKLPDTQQDLIVLVISSNDLFHFSPLLEFKNSTQKVLARYAPLGKKVVIIGPGRIFDADAVPLVAKPIYHFIAPSYYKVIADEAKKYPNVSYVNPIVSDSTKKYGQTGALDHFHPNDAGYEFWFDLAKPSL